MSTSVIEAQGLQKAYGSGDSEFKALKGVDMSVDRGDSLAIVGKSGSGKSTLMHLLALLDTPDHGNIIVNGVNSSEIKRNDLNKLRNDTFGFVFQQFFLVPSETVLENVMLPLNIAGVSSKKAKEKAMSVLKMVDLDDKAKNKATDLSGGQKQRTVIARALANDPDIIFADEPTGNLDQATSESIEDILFNLQKEQNITLVVVTHDSDLANKCGNTLKISDGLVVTGDVK